MMHADEVPIDETLVHRLLDDQFPQWSNLELRRVAFSGTDNAVFRLGPRLAVRMPRRRESAARVIKERDWLGHLQAALPLPIPVAVGMGRPAAGYPFSWTVCQWVPGVAATRDAVAGRERFAEDLGRFLLALQTVDPTPGPPPGEHNFFRGVDLVDRDDATREAIAAMAGKVDGAALLAVWERALAAPAARQAVWIHGDLDERNLLATDGRLSGVIDFGGLGVGDSACDVMVAWKLFDDPSRRIFRETVGADNATWERSRGWAISQAVIALAYYTLETHPALVNDAHAWIETVLGAED